MADVLPLKGETKMAFETGTKTPAELLAFVKKYALEHYEQDGWDIVIETMINADIEKIIAGTKTQQGAVYRMARFLKPCATYRAEIQGA